MNNYSSSMTISHSERMQSPAKLFAVTPPDWYQEVYGGCEVCGGTGFTQRLRFGQYQAAVDASDMASIPMCNCPAGEAVFNKMGRDIAKYGGVFRKVGIQQDRVIELFPRSKVPAVFKDLTLTTYRQATMGDGEKTPFIHVLADLYKMGSVLGEDGREQRGVLAIGPSGVGKTGALTAMYMHMRENGKPGLWITYHDLQDELRDFKDPRYQSKLGVLKRVDLLMIDEFGDPKGSPSDFQVNAVFDVIKSRHEKDLTTFLTSNLDMAAIKERFDERSARRIEDMCRIVQVGGKRL